jgi:hypothetical protein
VKVGRYTAHDGGHLWVLQLDAAGGSAVSDLGTFGYAGEQTDASVLELSQAGFDAGLETRILSSGEKTLPGPWHVVAPVAFSRSAGAPVTSSGGLPNNGYGRGSAGASAHACGSPHRRRTGRRPYGSGALSRVLVADVTYPLLAHPSRGIMRTGNALIDVILEIAVIAIVAAVVTWILGAVGAPGIIVTIVWILALVAILMVVIQLVQGGGLAAGPRRAPRRR